MSVLIRTDPHATYDDAKAAHPDWIAVDAHGNPRRHWSSPEMWVTCALGPYNFDFMTAVHKEIMSRYKPDGLFFNRWDGSGDCYCVHCTENFRTATGLDLPRTTNPQDPARKAYIQWRSQRLINLIDLWNTEIRNINPEASSIPNNGSGAHNPLDTIAISERTPMLVADRQARRGLQPPWLMGKTAKEYRATMGNKPVIGLFGVGLEEPYRWKDSVNSNAEIRIWVLDAIANGMRPWFSKFSATLHDERWLNGVEEIYLWTEKNQPYLTHQTTARSRSPRLLPANRVSTTVAISTPQRSKTTPSAGIRPSSNRASPSRWCTTAMLDAAHLAPYKTLILPNIAALSDAQCDQLRAFVKSGGNLIATHETSLYDEFGVPRKNFGLADLFAVDLHRPDSNAHMLNSYLRLEHQALPHHVIFTGLEDAPRIINGVSRLEVTPREPFAETPITLIPSYPDLPMEKVYPRVSKTDISCLYLRQPAGRVAYFPFDIDRTFWEVLCADHLKLLRNTIEWANNPGAQNEAPMIEVAGPGVLDVTIWQNSGSITIHLVNLTNPMTMKGPYRDFFPIGAQTIKLRLPSGIRAKQARLLVSEKVAPINRSGDDLILNVPSILDHEVVAIDI